MRRNAIRIARFPKLTVQRATQYAEEAEDARTLARPGSIQVISNDKKAGALGSGFIET
jgi:hypothetical protein